GRGAPGRGSHARPRRHGGARARPRSLLGALNLRVAHGLPGRVVVTYLKESHFHDVKVDPADHHRHSTRRTSVSTYRRRAVRAVSGLAMGAAILLIAACTTSDGPTTSGPTGGSLPKTLVFSPLSLAPPALKGLSEGVKGYAGSKGWDVIVQDPNFDP